MAALTTGAHPAVRPRLIRAGTGREGRAEYEGTGGYRPGREGPDLIAAVDRAGLRGRGGAAFPFARKLTAVAAAQAPERVVVVNGEEGEPASVKDRWLLRTRPHLVLDGALRAARAVNAATVYVYVSDRVAAASLTAALAESTAAGAEPAGAEPAVRIFEVGPSYVAGEETAAVNAINGRPAKPSDKPPRPFEEGVRGLPTLVANAETVANLPSIAAGGPADTFLLTLSGAVPRPGLYEVPFGVSIGEITRTLGGCDNSKKRAGGYLLGGYFAGLVSQRGHDLVLDYDTLRAEGTGLGCGAITVLGDGDCPVGAAALLLGYFGRENAGQCGACFNGTAAMAGVAAALARGEAGEAETGRLRSWCEFLPGRGACGTLDGAVNVAASLLREFPGEVRDHQRRGCARCAGTDFWSTASPYAVSPDPITPAVPPSPAPALVEGVTPAPSEATL